MKPKVNPIYIPLAKVLLWATTGGLLLVVNLALFRGDLHSVVSAYQTLAMIGMGVLGFHGFPRGRE